MNPNVVLPFLSSTLSLIFFVFLVDQWRERRRPYQAAWGIGMLWYALSAGTEWIGGALGWSEPLYRLWYLIGVLFLFLGFLASIEVFREIRIPFTGVILRTRTAEE